MNKSSFYYTGDLLTNLASDSFSLSMLIDWQNMGAMASLSSGNVKALKRESGVKNWVAFCKILVESIFVMLEEDPLDWCQKQQVKKEVSSKRTTAKKNPFVESNSDSDFETTKKSILQPAKPLKKPVKKTSVVQKLRKPEKERGGADFNLQMGLALSISADEVRKLAKPNNNLTINIFKNKNYLFSFRRGEGAPTPSS